MRYEIERGRGIIDVAKRVDSSVAVSFWTVPHSYDTGDDASALTYEELGPPALELIVHDVDVAELLVRAGVHAAKLLGHERDTDVRFAIWKVAPQQGD